MLLQRNGNDIRRFADFDLTVFCQVLAMRRIDPSCKGLQFAEQIVHLFHFFGLSVPKG
jgi:hypothetical protein